MYKGAKNMNPSPLRYPGGKYKLYSYISELVKQNDCSTYIEPFCGGAALAFELLLNKVVKRIIINDFDYSIYCFWRSILEDTDEFLQKLFDTNVTIEEWHRQKRIRDHIDGHTQLDVGFSTFFLNRTNRSGIIDKAGPIGGLQQAGNYPIDCRFNKTTLAKQITRIANERDKIALHNLEALDFIDDVILHTRKSFVFFDPPYYGKGPELYTNFYSHGDHVNLSLAILQKMKNRKWIVTYDNINEIKSMYAAVDGIEFRLQYTVQEKKAGSEVMFFSSHTQRPSNESDFISII